MYDRVLNTPVDYLSCFAVVLKGIHSNVDKCQTDYSIPSKSTIFPLLWSQKWKCNNQANHGLTKGKEKWSTIQFDVFVLSFTFFFPVSQTVRCHKQKWCMLFSTPIKLVAHVLVCAYAITCIKRRRLNFVTLYNMLYHVHESFSCCD